MAPKSRAAKKEMANPGSRLTLVRGGRRKKPVARSVKAGLVFPVARIGRYLKEGRYAKRIGSRAPVCLTAVLEHLAVELLEIAGNAAKDKRRSRIILRDLLNAIKSDEEVKKMLAGVTIAQGGVMPYIHSVLLEKKTSGKAAKSPTKTVGKAATSPGKTAVKPAKSPEKTAVRAVNSPKKTVKSPGKTAVKPAKSPEKTAARAVNSPKKTVKSPEKTAVKPAKSPKKTVVRAVNSPKKNAQKPAKSPKKTRGSPTA